MSEQEDRWAGFHINCEPEPTSKSVFNVSFGYGLAQFRDPNKPIPRVPSFAKVRIRGGENPIVLDYYPPGEDLGCTKEEYIAKAIEEVKAKDVLK